MAQLQFPTSPRDGDTHTTGGETYVFSAGTATTPGIWNIQAVAPIQIDSSTTGHTGHFVDTGDVAFSINASGDIEADINDRRVLYQHLERRESFAISTISSATNAVITTTNARSARIGVGDVIDVTGTTGDTQFNTQYTVTAVSGTSTITTSTDTSGFSTGTFTNTMGEFGEAPVREANIQDDAITTGKLSHPADEDVDAQVFRWSNTAGWEITTQDASALTLQQTAAGATADAYIRTVGGVSQTWELDNTETWSSIATGGSNDPLEVVVFGLGGGTPSIRVRVLDGSLGNAPSSGVHALTVTTDDPDSNNEILTAAEGPYSIDLGTPAAQGSTPEHYRILSTEVQDQAGNVVDLVNRIGIGNIRASNDIVFTLTPLTQVVPDADNPRLQLMHLTTTDSVQLKSGSNKVDVTFQSADDNTAGDFPAVVIDSNVPAGFTVKDNDVTIDANGTNTVLGTHFDIINFNGGISATRMDNTHQIDIDVADAINDATTTQGFSRTGVAYERLFRGYTEGTSGATTGALAGLANTTGRIDFRTSQTTFPTNPLSVNDVVRFTVPASTARSIFGGTHTAAYTVTGVVTASSSPGGSVWAHTITQLRDTSDASVSTLAFTGTGGSTVTFAELTATALTNTDPYLQFHNTDTNIDIDERIGVVGGTDITVTRGGVDNRDITIAYSGTGGVTLATDGGLEYNTDTELKLDGAGTHTSVVISGRVGNTLTSGLPAGATSAIEYEWPSSSTVGSTIMPTHHRVFYSNREELVGSDVTGTALYTKLL